MHLQRWWVLLHLKSSLFIAACYFSRLVHRSDGKKKCNSCQQLFGLNGRGYNWASTQPPSSPFHYIRGDYPVGVVLIGVSLFTCEFPKHCLALFMLMHRIQHYHEALELISRHLLVRVNAPQRLTTLQALNVSDSNIIWELLIVCYLFVKFVHLVESSFPCVNLRLMFKSHSITLF